jgi:phosphate transport system substrate-binding protein
MVCPKCHCENPAGARSCEKCGAALSDSAARKPLVAWLLVPVCLFGFAAALLWVNAGRERPEGALPSPDLPPRVVLRLHGSNTIGSKLAPALAEAFFRQRGAESVARVPGRCPEEVTVVARTPGGKAPEAIEISAHGSATAFKDLAAGTCDVGMSSRRVKPDEAEALSALGDLTAPASEHVLGIDGIAIIVHANNNALGALTLDQLADIFSGVVEDWAAVGGPAGPIHVYARDDNSGTYEIFKALVLGADRKLVTEAARFDSHEALRARVASDPQGIGFVGLPYTEGVRVVTITDKGASPMLPNKLTVGAEDYPLSRRLYLYTPAIPKSPLAGRLVDFALSSEGQKVVESVGFVSLNVELVTPVLPADAPAEYRDLTARAGRATLNFRFKSSSVSLDNRAQRDLDRLSWQLGSRGARGTRVLLFGFADDREQNGESLSLFRAQAVAAQLRARGITSEVVKGLGATNFVASNSTDEGREKNRRVEVWVE